MDESVCAEVDVIRPKTIRYKTVEKVLISNSEVKYYDKT